MKALFVLLALALPLLSQAGGKSKVEDDRFFTWYGNKEKISDFGFRKGWKSQGNKLDKKLEAEEEVLRWAEEAIKTRTDNIADIEAGKDLQSSVTSNHMFIATIYDGLFNNLSIWYVYDDKIYDLDKERQRDENNKFKRDMARSYPNCPKWNGEDLDDTEAEFSTGRIEHAWNEDAKKEYAQKAKPYLYILEMSRATWMLTQRASVGDSDQHMYDVSIMAIKRIDETMKLIKDNL
jgi:hypothetical protein